MPKKTKLERNFSSESYDLNISGKVANLLIRGRKLAPPSRRITLYQKGIKITHGKITSHGKKGVVDFLLVRVNHLSKAGEVRLHTQETMYPGNYDILISYELSPQKIEELTANIWHKLPPPELVPSADRQETMENANFKLTYSDGSKSQI